MGAIDKQIHTRTQFQRATQDHVNATDSRILARCVYVMYILIYTRTKECHHHPLRHIICDEWKKHTIRIDYLNWFPHFHFSIMDCVFFLYVHYMPIGHNCFARNKNCRVFAIRSAMLCWLR